MARQQPNQHHHGCCCNACVRRRNARRRREADRYREEGRPLPQGSQLYEIERDLPPVYERGPVEVRDIVEHVRSRTGRSIPPTGPEDFSNQRPAPTSPVAVPLPEPSQGQVVVTVIIVILVLASISGGIGYGISQLGWLQPKSPVVSLPTPTPPTPTPTDLPPIETPSPDAPTPAADAAAPTVDYTPTPVLAPAPIASPTPTSIVAIPTEREIVVNAFAQCDGQYSGADRQFRFQAANHAIDEGRQTVADIRRLVDEYCNGAFPELVAAPPSNPHADTSMASPTLVRPTATPVPTPTPTILPTPARTPTLRPTPTSIPTPGADGRFNQAEMEAGIHQLINAYRKEHGRTDFQWDDRLARIARAHSQDMADNDYYSHTNRAGEDPSARASKAGYNCNNPRSIGAAENIHLLYGHTSMLFGRPHEWETQQRMIQRFVADWASSPGHRRNILDPRYGKTGIGVAFGTAMGIAGGIYVTQKFC